MPSVAELGALQLIPAWCEGSQVRSCFSGYSTYMPAQKPLLMHTLCLWLAGTAIWQGLVCPKEANPSLISASGLHQGQSGRSRGSKEQRHAPRKTAGTACSPHQTLRAEPPAARQVPAGSLPRTMEVVLRNEQVEQARAGDKLVFTGNLVVVPDIAMLTIPGERVHVGRRTGACCTAFSSCLGQASAISGVPRVCRTAASTARR